MITLTTTTLLKDPNTKTTYIEQGTEAEEVTMKQHGLATNNDTLRWFRRLGGTETVTRGYTSQGYLVTKLVSTSPDKEIKKIREYKFS